ncbi:MAG: DUF1460 domain-containing protein [Nitrospirae bacterium]|nr:DUF1460 domain-containing protein [Nitrospirota bacterium]
MRKSSSYAIPGNRIRYISSLFKDTPYKESTLVGDFRTPEVFVIDLHELDCLTFIEYVEAMRLSSSFPEFEKNLKKIRYRSGKIAFASRKHFFTDWREFNKDYVYDATEFVGGHKTMFERKHLNSKADGTAFVYGLQPFGRKIAYIPSRCLSGRMIDRLKTGDYVGIYADSPGLDVTHVGILVKYGGKAYIRHASSQKKHRKVIDQEFKRYASGRPGIIVLRPK